MECVILVLNRKMEVIQVEIIGGLGTDNVYGGKILAI